MTEGSTGRLSKDEEGGAAEPIVIQAYNRSWPVQYRDERALILATLPIQGATIEHVGSTAVPGLAAKPVIDVLLGLRSLSEADQCIQPLERIGYRYRPEAEKYIPERRYFEKFHNDSHTHHLHVVMRGSSFWAKLLMFRDVLRKSAGLAAEYALLKEELAVRLGADRVGYALAKSDFVESVLRSEMKRL